MDYQTATPKELLHALEWAGRTPDLDLIRAALDRPGELTAGLLEMLAADPLEAYDDLEDDLDDDPRVYADIHAGLLLIAHREEQALPIFAGIFRNLDRDHLLEWFDTEFHHYGPAAVPMLLNLAHDEEVEEIGRYSAVEILAEIGRQYPETRDAIVIGLRSLLPDLRQDGPLPAGVELDDIWTWTASTLAQLRDEESKAQVIALYQAGLIDEFLMGDLDDYLGDWDRRPLGPPRHFDLLRLYQGLHRQAASDIEWQARREAIETAPPASIARPDDTPSQSAPGSAYPKAGRNDPCPCGSGLKYKKCHGRPGAT